MHLHSNSKKSWSFSLFRGQKEILKRILLKRYDATFHCRRYSIFKKKSKFFLTPKKWRNGPKKLLIIGPDPFISHSSPDYSPQSRIDFSCYEISGPDICSLICDLHAHATSKLFFSIVVCTLLCDRRQEVEWR